MEMADGEFQRSSKLQLFEHALEDWYKKDQAQNKSFVQVKNAMELHVRPRLKDFKLANIEKRDIIKIIDVGYDSILRKISRQTIIVNRSFNYKKIMGETYVKY